MSEEPPTNYYNPDDAEVWLIGTGIASLAAAVYSIHDANIPGSHIHILNVRTSTSTRSSNFGDWESGYTLDMDFLPFLLEPCTAGLLSHIPSIVKDRGSLLNDIILSENEKALSGYDSPGLAIQESCGFRIVQHPGTYLQTQDRKNVLRLMLEDEGNLEAVLIKKYFSDSFFMSDFWRLFSFKYALQPWHSAIEFHRHLCKYIEAAQMAAIRAPAQAQYTTVNTIIQPIKRYLLDQGVDFRTELYVQNLRMNRELDPEYVTGIQYIKDGKQSEVVVLPDDIVIATVGSTASCPLLGSDAYPPPPISSRAETVMDGYWSLWFNLARQSPKFGCPAAFCTHISESKVVSFTITLKGNEGTKFYFWLRQKIQNRCFVIFPGSNWSACLCLPPQPVMPSQPLGVLVLWGYALAPENHGNFTMKPLCWSTGDEIFYEILSHIGYQSDDLLRTSLTVPRVSPLATSPLLTRSQGDRPDIIFAQTRNFGLIGQFCEMKDETSSGMEYSVRSARMAVYALMGVHETIPKVRKNIVAQKYSRHDRTSDEA